MTCSARDDEIAHLARMAGLTMVFARSPRARSLWSKHHAAQLGELPSCYLTASDGVLDIEGLVIHGDWDSSGGWDLDGLLLLLAEDGEIIRLRGWMAEGIALR